MKIIINILLAAVTVLFAVSCNDGIDPINKVSPGEDMLAPVVTVNFPLDGVTQIRVVDDIGTVAIDFEVTDDIEIGTVQLKMDGTTIAEFDEFMDYRRALETYTYDELTNGDHVLSVVATDLSGKITTKNVAFKKVPPYNTIYDGEMFYMPFDGDFTEQVTITNATKIGSPSFSDNSVITGTKAYAGATDGYLTFPVSKITLGDEFSAAFWYKINAAPDRSGILAISAVNPTNPAGNNLTSGFRLFREGSGTNQTIKLNVGFGTDGAWFDGGATASINPTVVTDWVHIAFTISETNCVVYINGAVVSQGTFAGIDWTGAQVLSIASGAPNFIEWNHKSDLSLYDELRLFDKALTQAEVQAIIDDVE